MFRFSKRSESDIEPHEILLDSLAQKRITEEGLSEKKFEVPLLKKILQGFFFICVLIIALLLAKTFQLQIIEGKKLSELAQENKFIIYRIQAERGVIYDSDFNQLVFNQPSFDLTCQDPEFEVAVKVSQILKQDFVPSPDIIYQGLSHQELIVLETEIAGLKGCKIVNNAVREYKDGNVFSHILGYTGKVSRGELEANPGVYAINDYVGRTGVEKAYEDVLRKNPGELQVERNAQGQVILKEVISLPESGQGLVLWLDSGLQQKLSESLKAVARTVGSKKAAAVAVNPKTGGILALTSLPEFDNNLFSPGQDVEALKNLLTDPSGTEPLFNRAVSGQYPSGSTIKPMVALAALEEEIISPEKKIYDLGFIEIPHRYDPEISFKFLDWSIHGWTDMRKAIAESCNVYFYTIGGGYENQEGLGPTRIKKYLEFFGWGQATGVDLPGEASGFLPSPAWKEQIKNEGWWDGDTYHFSIGQGDLLVTPLQVAVAFSAIANQGKLLEPQVVKKVVDNNRDMLEEREPKIINDNFIDPANLQVVKEGMRQAVTAGSSVILNSLPVLAAAKTGTAQTSKQDYYHNWVTVFAPYDDPEIVLTVMLEDVKGLQSAALPVAKEVLEWYFTK